MDYLELHIEVSDVNQTEVITALLDGFQFDSFDIEGLSWKGYRKNDESLNWAEILTEYIPEGIILNWSTNVIPDQNWNATWETEYPLITIDDRLIIKAPFHEKPNNFEGIEVTIQPQMSFGTGHHQTTRLMATYLLNNPPINLEVLDMGTGTGILAILAEILGAYHIDAIDNEDWAFENAKENVQRNNCSKTDVFHDDLVPDSPEKYDLVIANINKNILFSQANDYFKVLKSGGTLLLSGFFTTDVDEVGTHFEENNIYIEQTYSIDDWAMCVCKKK